MLRIGCSHLFRANLALYAFFSHEPSDPLATQLLSLPEQLLVNAGTAIGLPRLQPNLLNSLQKAPVFLAAIRGLAVHPAVIAASAYIEYLGHLHYGKYVLVFSHKLENHPFFLVKMPIAFFKISRSIRTSAKIGRADV